MGKELEKEIHKKWEEDARTLHNLQEDELFEDSLDDLDGEWIFEETNVNYLSFSKKAVDL